MKKIHESIQMFCIIQLEILKEREVRLRKEIEDCTIQREFLHTILKDIGAKTPETYNIINNLLDITGRSKK
jgi:FtsZ-binding cell division protein ZapB